MSLSCKRSEYEARYANMDEKKRKRMASNRESAKRSRLKREQRVKDLVNEIATMKEEIFELNGQYNDLSQRARILWQENQALKVEKAKLAECLDNLCSICMRFRQMQSGCFSNQPWQQAYSQMQPIITTGMSES